MDKLTKRWPLGLDRRTWPDVLAWILLVLFVLVFVDAWASQTLQAWPDVWRAPFAFITDFGLSDWILIPSLIVVVVSALLKPFMKKGWWRRAMHEVLLLSAFVFVGVGLPGLATNLLKRAFGRGRPEEYVDVGAFSFQHWINDWTFQSFPSGHSTTAIAFAFVVGFIAPRFFRLFLFIALMTGFSRIVIGMHYPTDVVAGLVVGTIGAYAVRNVFAARRWLFASLPDGRVRFRGTPNLRRAWRSLRHRARL